VLCSYRGATILVLLVPSPIFTSADEAQDEHHETIETVAGLRYEIDFVLDATGTPTDRHNEKLLMQAAGQRSEIALRDKRGFCSSSKLLVVEPNGAPHPTADSSDHQDTTSICTYEIQGDFFASDSTTTISFRLLDQGGRPRKMNSFRLRGSRSHPLRQRC
jgi:hypothetical protein